MANAAPSCFRSRSFHSVASSPHTAAVHLPDHACPGLSLLYLWPSFLPLVVGLSRCAINPPIFDRLRLDKPQHPLSNSGNDIFQVWRAARELRHERTLWLEGLFALKEIHKRPLPLSPGQALNVLPPP
ncbi:hypothetical protein B0H13DRAFT_2341635 [Mycena leptocephala]|nr:hypothetical protein B0H13DRAFT_2341635 [Mycena leptocephala]